ncbi:MAG: ATP-dependent DNA helicase [Oscillatoriaceae cyanobacterium Prado104]|nr:ATP-dependent DNA helicase [Oscillatoriaceae cyanobacterium Prado104]
MIEVEVHNSLLRFLRDRSEPQWPHHLTMGRLVARALRLGRSALIQTGFPAGAYQQRYRVSYLMPLLLRAEPAIVVAAAPILEYLRLVEIPRLQEWLETDKPVEMYSQNADFRGLVLAEPEAWLAGCTEGDPQLHSGIPTIIDGADELETWTREHLTACLQSADWNELMQVSAAKLSGRESPLADLILQARVQLTQALFRHPANPYECYLLDTPELEILQGLFCAIQEAPESIEIAAWDNFWQRWESRGQLKWAQINRSAGSFSLFCAPVEVASVLGKIWESRPVVLIGGALDLETKAPIFRETVGLPELTSVKFSPDRQNELIQLYIPDGLPSPNTPEFQGVLIEEIRTLLCVSASVPGLTVLAIGDVPLKARLGALLASEFGSRVRVETTDVGENGILVTGWEFWRQHQGKFKAPHLLAVATLPLPSLENPLVAARVAYYKEQRKDWFRLYLLPSALNELQRAIAPVRPSQGVVAIFDNRVIHRSYGQQVLTALSPLARIDYLDTIWLMQG